MIWGHNLVRTADLDLDLDLNIGEGKTLVDFRHIMAPGTGLASS